MALGVPLRLPPENVTPPGRAPDSVMVGDGFPLVETENDPTVPTTKVVLAALVMVGADWF